MSARSETAKCSPSGERKRKETIFSPPLVPRSLLAGEVQRVNRSTISTGEREPSLEIHKCVTIGLLERPVSWMSSRLLKTSSTVSGICSSLLSSTMTRFDASSTFQKDASCFGTDFLILLAGFKPPLLAIEIDPSLAPFIHPPRPFRETALPLLTLAQVS